MDTKEFWHLINKARFATTDEVPFHEALTALLAARPKQQILEYQDHFDTLHDALYRWDVWAAAYLIGGGCSDDSFMDFRAGLIAQGRHWYERAVASPDALADHPDAIAAATDFQLRALFYEDANYCAADAYEQITGDRDTFWDDWKQYEADHPPADSSADPLGEDFDFDDENEMHRRLPRLADLFLPRKSG
ncbi:hypothetical protein AQJ23_30420 [Streptomyces antibioticus]|nr:DUF4240 domain-containing protein [Streptomyces antibioticus]KUN21250.1 hypothetical protein AQJ23_30420 [Streptomyces antibioticus]